MLTAAAKRLKAARRAVEAGFLSPSEFDKVLRDCGGKPEREANEWWSPVLTIGQ